MPAHRSNAEAEIRDAVVERLRVVMPGCRIIHEINCGSFGPNRIDVLAVTRDKIAAVEIKSERDKLERLPAQIASMRSVAHYAIAAIHEKFLTPLNLRISNLPAFSGPKEAIGAVIWAYPIVPRAGSLAEWNLSERWEKAKLLPPPGYIDLLWADELRGIVRRNALHKGPSGLDMPQLVDLIRWHLPGKTILRETCAALRRRSCLEADQAIDDFCQAETAKEIEG